MSQEFASGNEHLLRFTSILINVNHFKQDPNEIETDMIAKGKVQIASYCYSGNWTVADSRYDVLLGMSWHTEEHPVADYGLPRV